MKQSKIDYAHGTVVNIYIVYSLKNRTINDDFTVLNGLVGAVKITKDMIHHIMPIMAMVYVQIQRVYIV